MSIPGYLHGIEIRSTNDGHRTIVPASTHTTGIIWTIYNSSLSANNPALVLSRKEALESVLGVGTLQNAMTQPIINTQPLW